MSNPNPVGWSCRPDLSAMGAYAAGMSRVVESIQAVLPIHMGVDVDPVTLAKLAAWVEEGAKA